MMTAKEALKLSYEAVEKEKIKEKALKELEFVNNVVKSEAEKGYTTAVFSVSLIDTSVSYAMIEELKSLGYKATFKVKDKISSYIDISWEHVKEEI